MQMKTNNAGSINTMGMVTLKNINRDTLSNINRDTLSNINRDKPIKTVESIGTVNSPTHSIVLSNPLFMHAIDNSTMDHNRRGDVMMTPRPIGNTWKLDAELKEIDKMKECYYTRSNNRSNNRSK